ncbi:hypothetical protein ABPG74_021802 [Tetrahymena malaccensis]
MYLTKIISLFQAVSFAIQSLIFISLSFVFQEKLIYILILLFNLPLIVICISIVQQFNRVLKLKKTFKSQQEILPFLKKYPNEQALLIQQEDNQDQTKYDNEFKELEEQELILTEQEQYDLLSYLYYKKDKQAISIQQYNILIKDSQIFASSIASKGVFMQLLCEVEEIPKIFLPPQSYMNLDIQKLQLQRCLFLRIKDILKLNNNLIRNQIYLTAFQQSIQIKAFIQNIAFYINVNPTQVLYDLYSFE